LHPEVKRHLVMSEAPATVLVDYATTAIKRDSRLCNLGVINRRPTTNPKARFHISTKESAPTPPGDPMDLDATRRFKFTRRPPYRGGRRTSTDECYNCGKRGISRGNALSQRRHKSHGKGQTEPQKPPMKNQKRSLAPTVPNRREMAALGSRPQQRIPEGKTSCTRNRD